MLMAWELGNEALFALFASIFTADLVSYFCFVSDRPRVFKAKRSAIRIPRYIFS